MPSQHFWQVAREMVSWNPVILFFLAASVHRTESGSPARWARPALSAAGGGSGQRAQRAPTRGPSLVRRQRRLWRPATVPPTACCTAVDSMPHRLRVQAVEAAARRAGGARRARTRTSCRTSACESAFQRPPTSTARTKRRWPPPRCNSG